MYFAGDLPSAASEQERVGAWRKGVHHCERKPGECVEQTRQEVQLRRRHPPQRHSGTGVRDSCPTRTGRRPTGYLAKNSSHSWLICTEKVFCWDLAGIFQNVVAKYCILLGLLAESLQRMHSLLYLGRKEFT